jgi:hypothetical protein
VAGRGAGRPPAAAEWAHDQLADDELDYLRRLPAERRLWPMGEMVLVCHGSPGSQTNGLPADLDPAITVERVTRTDARVIACGHTHVADVRELGRKLIVNPGSCGYAFDGEPSACWALLTATTREGPRPSCSGPPTTRRPPPRRSPSAAWPATSTARPRSAPAASFGEPMSDGRRRVVVTGMGAVTPLGNDVATFWRRLVAGESGVRTIAGFDPSRLDSRIAGEVRRLRPSGVLDRKEVRRNDRYTQFMALVAGARRWITPACRSGWTAMAERDGRDHRLRAWVARAR